MAHFTTLSRHLLEDTDGGAQGKTKYNPVRTVGAPAMPRLCIRNMKVIKKVAATTSFLCGCACSWLYYY